MLEKGICSPLLCDQLPEEGQSILMDHVPALNIAKPGLYDVKDQDSPFSEVNTFRSQLLKPMARMGMN